MDDDQRIRVQKTTVSDEVSSKMLIEDGVDRFGEDRVEGGKGWKSRTAS